MDLGVVGFHSKTQSLGYGFEGGGLRGPFSASQWMELEHQALIYKYLCSNVPIPSYLLNPIRKAFQSAAACYYTTAGIRSNPLAWGGLHLGYCGTDPEPGRCRRTDGKKWRCSREAVAEGKYCERHMNRGRHRSRKPVEGHQSGGTNSSSITTNTSKPPSTPTTPSATSNAHHRQPKSSQPTGGSNHQQSSRRSNEFGLVFHDSLLNPLNKASSSLVANNLKSRPSVGQMANPDWPDVNLQLDGSTRLSISAPTRGNLGSLDGLEMGLGMGMGEGTNNEPRQATTNWVPISWDSAMGGPLGEVLHTGECANVNVKPLNLMDSSWEHRPVLATVATGL